MADPEAPESPVPAKGRRLRFLVAIFIIFVVPATLVFAVLRGFSLLKKIEPSESLQTEGIARLGDFELHSHQGDTLRRETFEEKVWLAHFFRPSCQEPCKPRLRAIGDVQYAVSKFKHFRIMSSSLEPVDDRNAIWSIGRFYSRYAGWHFSYGDTARIRGLMDESGLAGRKFAWDCPTEVALVDRQGSVRGYYDPLDSVGYRNLVNDIIVLLRRHDE